MFNTLIYVDYLIKISILKAVSFFFFFFEGIL